MGQYFGVSQEASLYYGPDCTLALVRSRAPAYLRGRVLGSARGAIVLSRALSALRASVLELRAQVQQANYAHPVLAVRGLQRARQRCERAAEPVALHPLLVGLALVLRTWLLVALRLLEYARRVQRV